MATTLTSWLSNDPAIWSTGVVPWVGDAVDILHPGTNWPNSTTQYLTNTAGYAIGATNITLTSGTGTIVAWESIQFQNSIGTDENGYPIYDNNYYKVATGITWPWVIVLSAPWLAVAIPASAIWVVNRGHVVEQSANHIWGNDTNTAIQVRGTLKASRSGNYTLTCRGSCVTTSGGTYDFGCYGDVVTTNTTVIINDSATLAVWKYAFGSLNTSLSPSLKIRGIKKTRNTSLIGATLAWATSITVANSLNWAIGDRLAISADGWNVNNSQVVTITGGASPTWSVTAITRAKPSGSLIWNLSSNITFKSMNPLFPWCFWFAQSLSSDQRQCVIDVWDFRVEDVGYSGWWVWVTNVPTFSCGFAFQSHKSRKIYANRIAVEAISLVDASSGLWTYTTSQNRHEYVDCALYLNFNQWGVYNWGNSRFDIRDVVIYRCSNWHWLSYWWCADNKIYWGTAWCANSVLNGTETGRIELNNFTGYGNNTIFNSAWCFYTFNSCTLSAPRFYNLNAVGWFWNATFNNCTLTPALLAGSLTATATNEPSEQSVARVINANATPTDNRVLGHYQTTISDTVLRKNGGTSVKIKPNVSNTNVNYYFSIPAVNGVTQKIKWSLRFDSTYGTWTPPVLTLSGKWVSETFTCPATADTWHPFEFDFTPNDTGDIDCTLTVKSTSILWFAYLDGIYHFPMIQKVRHYGYLWKNQASQEVFPFTTQSDETIVTTYPFTVDHVTKWITATADYSYLELRDYLPFDLCKPENIGIDEYYSFTSDTIDLWDYNLDCGGFDMTGSGNLITTWVILEWDTSVVIKDSVWVRCTIVHDSSTFTIKWLTIPYTADVLSYKKIIAPNTDLSFVMWRLGHTPKLVTINSWNLGGTFEIPLTDISTSVDIVTDVSAIIALTTTIVDVDGWHLYMDEMTLDIETQKSVVHRLMKYENYFDAVLATSDDNAVSVESDEIKVNNPVFFIHRKVWLPATDEVILNGYINTTGALALNPAYVINPYDVNNKHVELLKVKPALDASYLAGEVWGYDERTLTASWLTAQEHDHLLQLRNRGGGGTLINYESIEKWLAKDREWLYKKIEEIPWLISSSETNIMTAIWLVNTSVSTIIGNKDVENLSESVWKLAESTEEATKLAKEVALEWKQKSEKLSHTIETYRLEDEIKQETKDLTEKHEIQIQEEVRKLALEAQIQEEVKSLASNL